MKKYILRVGIIAASPMIIAIVLYYLFYFLPFSGFRSFGRAVVFLFLWLLSLPTFFLPSLLPYFGSISVVDALGAVPLSNAISAVIYYFIFGMAIGWLIYRFKGKGLSQ